MQNQIAVNQQTRSDLKPVLSTQIDTIKQALQGIRVIDCSDHQLSKALSVIYSLIGLRPQHFPTEAEDGFLFAFLRTEYGLKTTDELVLAFKLAIKDELDIEDAKVYDQFTCEYLARIMTAYRKWLKDKNMKVEPVKSIEKFEYITTEEEKLEDIRDWESRTEWKLELIPPYIYDYLVEFGKLNLTNAQKWDYTSKAAEIRKQDLREAAETGHRDEKIEYNQYQSMMINGFTGFEKERLKNLAKKVAVADYLKNLPR